MAKWGADSHHKYLFHQKEDVGSLLGLEVSINTQMGDVTVIEAHR